MRATRCRFVTTIFLIAVVCAASASEQNMIQRNVNWPDFLGRLDPLWERMPDEWGEAPFLGNGTMGVLIRRTAPEEVRWNVGHTEVLEQRPEEGVVYGRCRLPIGDFVLKTVGKVTGAEMRIDLWNAEATGAIHTDKGDVSFRTFVHAERMAIVSELTGTGGESEAHLVFDPAEAVSPRRIFKKDFKNFTPNPKSTVEKDGSEMVCVQPLLKGGEIVTAWHEGARDGKRLLIASVAQSFPECTARAETLGVVRDAWKNPTQTLVDSHRAWWHAFYPESFITFPDTRWESFYWIQIYKLASATRADRALIDTSGPWMGETPWPAAWWNMNMQLNYWPAYGSNRLHLGESLWRHLDTYRDNLKKNVPEPYRRDSMGIGRAAPPDLRSSVRAPSEKRGAEIGNLPWGLHNVYLHYRYTMDDTLARDVLFPLLKESINYYYHFLKEGDDGKLHLARTHSPEYGEAPDCNYDLALLRWGCGALLELSQRLGIDDPLAPKWRETLEKLTDYPKDETGFIIGADTPFAKGHRHFSHLLMVYPLYLVNIEQPGVAELVDKSMRHWKSLGAWMGFSYPGAASLYAAIGKGDEALAQLNDMRYSIRPNTLSRESGPVIETSLAVAQSIHDMFLQSWGGTIRVFPAVPSKWADVAFDDLRAEGAFLVSAARRDGKTAFVRVKSLAGEPCVIRTDLPAPIRAEGPDGLRLQSRSDGSVELNLKKGEEAVLYSGNKPDLAVAPVSPQPKWLNPYGLKAALGDFVFTWEPPRKARYVRVMLPGDERVLSLAEVEVFSGGKNIATEGKASQSSLSHGGVPERAIDGNTDGEWKHKSVTHTKITTANPWWEVDLGREASIERIAIWNRSILKHKLKGFHLILMDASRKEVWRGQAED